MLKFIGYRILQAIPVLLVVIAVTFLLVRMAPGGPFDEEKAVSPYVLEKLNERYNLNAPLPEQFFDYLSGILQGDFGPSFKFPTRSVNRDDSDWFGNYC